MERIPTVPFDPAKHVISCRENAEGRQVFVTLESLMQAEDVIDWQPTGPDVRGLSAWGANLGEVVASKDGPFKDFATRTELAMMRDAIAKAVSANMPPPELPAELASTLAALGQAMAQMRQQIAAMQSVVDAHTATFEVIKTRLGQS